METLRIFLQNFCPISEHVVLSVARSSWATDLSPDICVQSARYWQDEMSGRTKSTLMDSSHVWAVASESHAKTPLGPGP